MITIQGQGIAMGIAVGPLRFFCRPNPEPAKTSADRETEKLRLRKAQRIAAEQLEALADRCRNEVEEAAALFETHAMLVEDEDFVNRIHCILEEDGCSAQYAVDQAGREFAAMFAAMDDAYMQARADDIRDVSRRILDALTGGSSEIPVFDSPIILFADDLSPSETLQLDKTKILGFVTQKGSVNSHTAILARAMGIPAVCTAGTVVSEENSGRLCCIDGETGQLLIDPDLNTLSVMQIKLERQQERKRLLQTMKGLEDVTPDGKKITLCCNIGSPEEVSDVLVNDGRGIGLFRSEFLYLRTHSFPSEEEQFSAYRAVAAAMEGRRVVIRTLDLGADKQADYFGLRNEDNPALGLRGVRVCLDRPDIFRTQLRAIYRASVYGRIAIMFPMISALWEVRACKELCQTVMSELTAEGIPYDKDTEIGIMIETPAAVLTADELAGEVDFFSVGTNDLTQYTLACDRQASNLGKFFDPRHPAVLRSVKMAADAHSAGIRIGICGELAADPDMLPDFLAMGIDELSVSPAAVLPLRAAIRNL